MIHFLNLGSVGENHLSWVLVADCLHHILLQPPLPQHLLALLLVPPEELQVPAHHPLHVGDDHDPRIGDAVIVPVIYRTQ